MAAASRFSSLTSRLTSNCSSFLLPHPNIRHSRTIATSQKLVFNARTDRRQTREGAAARPKKQNQYAQRAQAGRQNQSRNRPSPSRARHRPSPPREYVLPDLGLTSEQLAALASISQPRVFKCAKELDESVHDANSLLSPALVELVTEELSLNLVFQPQTTPLLSPEEQRAIIANSSETRMPVITVMGHVDHGKTSLLDALRNSDVAKHERGGITQSVAAFKVSISTRNESSSNQESSFATFIDTPGHAAFKAMRANGTVGTDIVILVVAADDGVMPQTIEAADLARSANVPIVVAVNKCDMPGADPERVRYQLLEKLGINTEQLGGDVQCVDISAKTGSNLPLLLEAVSLQAEMLDLRTRSDALGHGVCLESRIDKSLGSIATVVVRTGSLKKGDHLVFQSPRALHGHLYGKVRGLIGSDSLNIDKAGPGVAVGVVGIKETIPPGAEVRVVSSEREARTSSQGMGARNGAAVATIQVANAIRAKAAEKLEAEGAGKDPQNKQEASSLDKGGEGAEDSAGDGPQEKPRNLVVLIKGDVQGSADAVSQCIQALGSAELPVRIIGAHVGDVNEKDVQLAAATNKVKGNKDISMIVAFNVRAKDAISKTARRLGLTILEHSLIYHLEDQVKERIDKVVRENETKEVVQGRASVVRVFEDGTIAGCSVAEGAISDGDTARVLRFPDAYADQRVLHEVHRGTVATIKRFAKKVRSVEKGSECGVSLRDWSEFVAGDEIEFLSTTAANE